jgi:hypothetical protein
MNRSIYHAMMGRANARRADDHGARAGRGMATRSAPPKLGLGLGIVIGSLLTGCRSPESVSGFGESDPAARLRAIREAARTESADDVASLVDRLGSDDPAERLFSIRSLERITTQTMGYDHAAPSMQREEAIARWIEWLNTERDPTAPTARTTRRPPDPAAPPQPSVRSPSPAESNAPSTLVDGPEVSR